MDSVNRVYAIEELNPSKTDWLISVKVLSKWRPPYYCLGQMIEMILCDEKGTRIGATIPPISYKFNFERDLIEGEWYGMSNFRVIDPPKWQRNSNHRYQIKCLNDTNMYRVSQRSKSNFFNFVSFADIAKNQITDSFVHDAYGVIWSVDDIKTIPFVAKEDGIESECRVVSFQLKDACGKIVNCCAIGEYCDRFMHMWTIRGYNSGFRYQKDNDPVICVLRSWKVSSYDGYPCLINGYRCSKIFMNHYFFEIEKEKLLIGFKSHLPFEEQCDAVEEL